jgi:hypothetical protein
MPENSTNQTIPERVPDVTEVTGAYFEPISSMVQLQYKSGDRLYEIRFPLEEVLRAEDWFIQIRKHVGDLTRTQKGHR